MLFALNILLLWAIVLKEGSSKCLPTLHPLTRFSPSLFVVLQEILHQPSFLLRSNYWKNNVFSKQNSFFPSTYCSLVLVLLFSVYEFLRTFFKVLPIKLEIASYLHKCMASYLASHQILEHNQGIHGHSLKIASCSFFVFREN